MFIVAKYLRIFLKLVVSIFPAELLEIFEIGPFKRKILQFDPSLFPPQVDLNLLMKFVGL